MAGVDEQDHSSTFGASMVQLGYDSIYKKRRTNLEFGFGILYKRNCQVYNRLGQVMALVSAANVEMKKDPSMPFIMTGDFNALPRTQLTDYVLSAMNPPKADELRALIRTGRESMDLLVSHPVRMSSTYSLDNLVDFILYGRIVGGPLWQLSHASSSLRGCNLKGGLPAGHVGLDHFAPGAKFCIMSRESEVGSSSTEGYNPFLDKVEKITDFDKTRYFH
ncbi:hypothetical protein BGZ68_003067 [Mortierella alpina]|nr:hypothetical protein BGZ68_003067 [Mortierella alpina]